MKREKFIKNLSKLKDNDYDVVILSLGFLPATWFVTKEYLKKGPSATSRNGIPIENIVTSNINSWTIHGIWPKKLDTSKKMTKNYKPLFAKGKDYTVNSKMVDFIEPALKIMQPNLKDDEQSSKKEFLEYQYRKHGSALTHPNGSHYTFNEYMDLSLGLYHQYNINTILACIKVIPGCSYVLGHIYESLARFLGKRPLIKLAKNYKSGNFYLHEILLYFDKSYNLIDAEVDDVPLHTKVFYARNSDDIIHDDNIDYPLGKPFDVVRNPPASLAPRHHRVCSDNRSTLAVAPSQNPPPLVRAFEATSSKKSVSNVGCHFGINIHKWKLFIKLKLNFSKSKSE